MRNKSEQIQPVFQIFRALIIIPMIYWKESISETVFANKPPNKS